MPTCMRESAVLPPPFLTFTRCYGCRLYAACHHKINFVSQPGSHQKEHLFDWAHPSSGQLRPVKRDPRLVPTRCPPEVGLQFRSFLKIGNITDSGNEGGRLDVPNRRDGEEDLPLTAIGHDSADLCLQEGQVVICRISFPIGRTITCPESGFIPCFI